MSSQAAEYRLHAAECLDLAERVTDLMDKARLIKMAQAFFELANKFERTEIPTREPSDDSAGAPQSRSSQSTTA